MAVRFGTPQFFARKYGTLVRFAFFVIVHWWGTLVHSVLMHYRTYWYGTFYVQPAAANEVSSNRARTVQL